MWIRSSLCVLLLMLNSSNGLSFDCKPPWVRLRRACYKFVTTKETWTRAQMHCNLEGGDLISIVSMAEKSRIRRHLMRIITTPDMRTWWVGLSLARSKGQWIWQDGTPLDIRITSWTPGEPNNARSEHCAEMSYAAMLNDMDCNMRKPFICERISITKPPTQSTTPQPVSTTSTTAMATTTTTAAATTTSIITTTDSKMTKSLLTSSKVDKEKPTAKPDDRTVTKLASDSTKSPPMKETTEPEKSTDSPRKTTVVVFQASSSSARTSTITSRGSGSSTKEPRKYCPSVKVFDIEWLRAGGGETVSRPCKYGNGRATWVCGQDPVEWVGEPDVSACASDTFTELVSSIDKLTMENKPLTADEATEIATKLSERTDSSRRDLSAADVMVSTSILKKASKVELRNTKQATKLIQYFASAGSNIMKQTKVSEVIQSEDKSRSASRLLEAIEEATKTIVDSIDEPTVIQKKEEKLSLTVQVVNTSLTHKITYDNSEDENVFSIPVLQDFSKDGLAKVVFVTYYDIGDMLPTGEESQAAGGLVGVAKTAKGAELVVASNVISASIGLQQTVNLPEPVNFTIRLSKWEKEFAVPLCSFWDFNKGEYGAWSQEGCHKSGSNDTHVSCQCNHLTNFAILLDVTGVQLMYHHSIVLQYITLVGCIVSIVSLFTCWLTFQCLGTLQNERNSIHKNLVFCLFSAEIIFLIGINRTEEKVACAAIALLLHFFFLAAFTWMLMEGIHIVVMLIQVFDAARSRLKYYYLFGYGVPILIVAATATIDFTAYGTRQFCWLTTDKWFIWSFAGPVAVVLLVNACILAYSLSMVCRHADYVFSSDRTGGTNYRAWIQGALAIEVLLGLTWVFGYMYINQETVVMAYIFTALNSLQGLFIFVFHCLFNKKVRNEYKKLVHLSKKAQSSTKSSSLKKPPGSASYELYVPANSS